MLPQVKFKLTFVDGPSEGRELEFFQDGIILGRDAAADVALDSPAVSRQHARLSVRAGRFILEDLGSSNGTFVNGERLSGETVLDDGDEIRLGLNIKLRFSVGDSPAHKAKDVESPKPAQAAETDLDQPRSTGGGETRVAQSTPTRFQAGLVQTELQDEGGDETPRLLVSVAGESRQEYPITKPRLTLGRAEDNDIVIHSPIVSRRQATLEALQGSYRISPIIEAKNPLYLEGNILVEPHLLQHGDTLRIGGADPGVMVTLVFHAPNQAVEEKARPIQLDDKALIRIGREKGNDVVLDAPTVSRFHAEIERVGQRLRIRDLNSANGSFVNDQRVYGETWLKAEDNVRIGPARFVVGADQLAQFDESGGLRVEAFRLNKWVRKDLNILKDISLVFNPREFIVVVGQSGGGKSTLVDAISGFRPATHGRVLVNGVDVYRNFDTLRSEIGFVPQKDTIHMELTIYQALDYAAQLRMPADTNKSERHRRIMEVLNDLDLVHRKDVQISGLSGGQQKRVSIGVELLTRPGLFFLDEPTSGLDPGTETALMQLMRRLADKGSTIVLITHATKNVMLADKVVFLARDGYLAWFGPPEEALQYFDQYRSEDERRSGKMEFDQIYAILDDAGRGKREDWDRRYREHPAFQKYILAPLQDHSQQAIAAAPSNGRPSHSRFMPVARHNQVSSLRQFIILSSRNIRILLRDRFSLALMLMVPVLVSLLDVVLAVTLGNNPYSFDEGHFPDVLTTLFMLTIFGVFVGALSQMREFVKETDIYKRERMVNLKVFPYVISKIWVAAFLAAYQTFIYVLVHFLAFKMPGGLTTILVIYASLLLGTLAGMMLGLVASALAPNANAASLIVVVFMLPQIVLGGVVIPLPEPVSRFTSTRWAFEGMLAATGATTDVAADACWALPEDLRDTMSLEEKQANNCRCMGLNALNQASCDFPGLGKFHDPAVDDPEPIAPVKPGDPPPDPVLPEKPVEPANQADNIAMSAYFDQLKAWENEVNIIQDQYKQDVAAYQGNVNIYQAQLIDYQEKLSTWQITRNAAVNKAEGTIANLLTNYGWSFVDKSDPQVYWLWIFKAWLAQGLIITLAFVTTLILIKRKDQI